MELVPSLPGESLHCLYFFRPARGKSHYPVQIQWKIREFQHVDDFCVRKGAQLCQSAAPQHQHLLSLFTINTTHQTAAHRLVWLKQHQGCVCLAALRKEIHPESFCAFKLIITYTGLFSFSEVMLKSASTFLPKASHLLGLR